MIIWLRCHKLDAPVTEKHCHQSVAKSFTSKQAYQDTRQMLMFLPVVGYTTPLMFRLCNVF
jgi:hypothetical protein